MTPAHPTEAPTPPRALRVLIVDDSPEDAEIYTRLLRQATAHPLSCTSEELGEDGLDALRRDPPDCVLLDYNLPDMTGLEFLSVAGTQTPIILMTGVGDEEIAVNAMNAGAQDYIVKGRLKAHELLRTVERAIEKHRLQRDLTDSRLQMQTVLDSVGVSVLSLGTDLNLEYLNEAARTLLHLPPGTPAHLREHAPWLYAAPFDEAYRMVLATGGRMTFETRHPEQPVWLDVRVNRSAGGLSISLTDVTQRRLEEERLRLLESVVVNAREAVVIAEAQPTHPPGPRVVYVNEAFTDMTGYAPEEIVGLTPRILQGPASDRAALDRIRDGLTRWDSISETVLNYRKDGTPFWVQLSITPVADRSGWFTHWVSVQRDVTAEVKREQHEQARRDILEMAAEGRPLEDVLTAICRLVSLDLQTLPVTAWIRNGDLLTLLASEQTDRAQLRDLAHAHVDRIDRVDLSRDQGATVQAVNSRELVVVENIHAPGVQLKDGVVALLEENAVQAMWVYPILPSRAEERPLGVISIFPREARRPTPAELVALADAAGLATLILERSAALGEMQRLALHDSLTGLPNRPLYLELLTQAIHATTRDHARVAVALLDLDRFKTINDTLGHTAGDRLLVQVARRLTDTFRPTDTIARMGGDEFTLILPFSSDPAVFQERVAQRLHACFDRPFDLNGQEVFVSASLGLAFTPDHGRDPEQLLSAADLAMYHAKRTGTHVATYQPDLLRQDTAVISLEADLYRAQERGELELFHQPIVHAQTRALVGTEALIRWHHPRLGLVSPAQFIPLAESTGLILTIGAWVLRQACMHLAEWHRTHPHLSVSVNLSPRQFWQPDLIGTVRDALEVSGIPPEALILEITEGVLMDIPDAEATLRALRDLGVRLALDDFGTGYSSLSYLRRFPLTSLKIDRSFMEGVIGDDQGTPENVVRAVMLLAHALGLTVTSEGVENETQANFIRSVNGELLQGYLFSRPLPVQELTDAFLR